MIFSDTHTIQSGDDIAEIPKDFEYLLELIEEYLQEHYSIISDPNFEDILVEDILKLIGVESIEDDNCVDLEKDIYETLVYFYSHFMPRRSFHSSLIFKQPDITTVKKHIEHLQSIPQPTQRTDEWYDFRHNLITASDLYKALDSNAVQNSLIYSKCNKWKSFGICKNVNSSLHWGQKYEPLSVMLYEYIYKTKISELGCIRHPQYYFLGASPDGINTCETSPRFGRLLEIKNVVSREIDGIPTKEYWIQMQAQMEVCDIDECDFLETKFIEYPCYNDYINDVFDQFSHDNTYTTETPELEDSDTESDQEKEPCKYPFKGLIMMFTRSCDGSPYYIFKPLDISLDEEEDWEDAVLTKQKEEGNVWVRNIYWKLEVFSCVLVLRNRFWFQKSLPAFKHIWDIVETERITGCSHRAPKKKQSSCLLENITVVKIDN
jgi:putative phage-type endonuclease